MIKKISIIYLLFNFLLYSPTIASDDEIRVLSINSRGTHTLIPARLFQHLEEKLSEEFEQKVNLAKIFHIMSGRFTGSVIPLALTLTETANQKPIYKAKDIFDFYRKACEKIYYKSQLERSSNHSSSISRLLNYAYRSCMSLERIDEIELRNSFFDFFQDSNLGQVLSSTQILIPAISYTNEKRYIFDSKKAAHDSSQDFKITEILNASIRDRNLHPTEISNNANVKYIMSTESCLNPFANQPGLQSLHPLRAAFTQANINAQNPINNRRILIISIDTDEIDNTEQDHLNINNGEIISFLIKETKGISAYNSHHSNINQLIAIADKYKQDFTCKILEKLEGLWPVYNPHILALTLNPIDHINSQGITITVDIDLSDKNISDKTLYYIHKFCTIPNTVTKLNLARNNLTANAIPFIKNILESYPNIKKISLDENLNMRDEGLECISTNILTKLDDLSINECGITSIGYLRIATFYLQYFIQGNNVNFLPILKMENNNDIEPNDILNSSVAVLSKISL